MYHVKVNVTLRTSILDAAGNAVLDALHKQGYDELTSVRIGKTIYLETEHTDNLEARVKEMAEKLLVNTVMEDYTIEITEGA